MNGEKKKIHFICSPDEKKSTSLLNRPKITTLDWKKIASIDIDKIIHTSNAELLEELLSQIAFCKAEAEFDSQNADSGFLKVFKLSQIIIEHLLHTQDILESKYEDAMAQCKEIQDNRLVQVKEIQSLKETLSAARRELKRRKELLASAQSEVIGENKDEFDPCPYCSKRFLTSAYLLSHMQRRHQGLPLHPVFPAQSIFQDYLPKFVDSDYHHQRQQRQYTGNGNHSSYPSPLEIQFQKASSAAHYSDSQGTQTEKTDKTGQEKMSLKTISALVEQCLKEKSFLLDKDHDKSAHNQFSTKPAENNALNIPPNKDDNTYDTDATSEGKPRQVFMETSLENKKKDGEEATDGSDSVKEIMAEIKHQLDLQWKYLSGKINQVGLEELKSLVVNEPGEVQGKKVIPSPNPKMSTQLNCIVTVEQNEDFGSQGCDNDEMRQASTPTPTPSLITEHVEERFQKQQNDLVTLKKDLQSKMEEDMIAIESKLESQERYWRAKLRLVEDEYSQQFTKLREEFQESLFLHKNNTQREYESVTRCATPAPAPAPTPMQWSQSIKPTVSPDNHDQDEHQIYYDDTFTSESPGLVTYKQLVSVQHQQQQQQQQQQQPQFSAHENSQPNSQTVSLANSPQSISDLGHHEQQQQIRALPRISMNRNQVQSQSFLPPEMHHQKQQFVVTAHGDADSEVSPKSTHVDVGPFGIIYNDPAPLLVNNPQLITTVQTKKVVSGPVKPSRTSPNTENSVPVPVPVPVPRPRSVSVPPLAVSPSPTPPQDNNDDQHDMVYTTDKEDISTHQHEYEEPDNILKLDHVEEYCYSVAEAAYDDDGNVVSHNYRIPLKHGHAHGHSHHKSQEKKGKKSTVIARTTTEEEAVTGRMEKIREKVKSDINNQLESLGLAADGTEIDQQIMEKAIKKMDARRESAIEEAPILEELRDQVMKETKMALLSTSIQDRLSGSLHATPEKTAKSPLIKMMSAFKMSGKKMHRKVKSAIRKEPKQRKSKSPTLPLPLSNTNTTSKKESNSNKAAGFFSRARWGRGKNNKENTNSLAVSQEHTNKDGSNKSSDSQSDSEDSSASSEPDVEVHYMTKPKPLQSSTPIVPTKSKIKTRENLESDVKIEDEVRAGEMSSASSYETEDESQSVSHSATPSSRLAKKKLTVKDNKASKLRYREARKNSMAAAATAAELTSRENNKDKTLPKSPPAGQKLIVNPFLVNQKHGNENGKDIEKKVSSGKSGEHLKKQSVRRSLQAEFDQVTPKNGDKPSSSRAVAAPTPTTKDETSGSGSGSEVTSESESETDDKTDIESSSSWDEMAEGAPNLNHQAQAGEYVTLASSKYTLERNKHQSSSPEPEPENSALIREVSGGPQRNSSSLQRGRVNTGVTRTMTAESLSLLNPAPKHDTAYKPGGSSRPQTAKNRIVMDSWDTDDEDVGVHSSKAKVEPQLILKNEPTDKPSLVSERWNDQPLYLNTNRKKIPMAVVTTTTETLQDKQKKTKSRGKSQGHEDPTESPFNNSWDSS